MKKKHFFIATFISVLFFVSCGHKQIDKSRYEFIDLEDAGLGTIGIHDPIKYYAANAKYRDFSKDIRTVIGQKKNQSAFAHPETDVISFFSVKCKMPKLKDEQIVTIYFSVTRINSGFPTAEIHLIE